jgi:hypothetical protein
VLAVLVRNGRGSVTSQEQGDQWNSSNHIGCWCNIQARGWRGLIQLGHPSTLHRPADRKFQLLKCAEQDQVVIVVIRPVSVVCILRGSPSRWTQVAGKEKLRTSVPTVFQRNIIILSFNAVRIRRDNNYGVLHTTKLIVQIKSSIYIHEHCIYDAYAYFVTCMYMYIPLMYFTFGFIP